MSLLRQTFIIYVLILSRSQIKADKSHSHRNEDCEHVSPDTGLHNNNTLLNIDSDISDSASMEDIIPITSNTGIVNEKTLSNVLIVNSTKNITETSAKELQHSKFKSTNGTTKKPGKREQKVLKTDDVHIVHQTRDVRQVMDSILKDIEILTKDTNPVYVNDVQPVIERVNNITNMLLATNVTLNSSILLGLDNLINIINLNESLIEHIIENNVALLILDPQIHIAGLNIVNTGGNSFTNTSFQYFCDKHNKTLLWTNVSDAVIYIPDSLLSRSRVGFVIFRQDYNLGRFKIPYGHPYINSPIININVDMSHHDRIQYYLKPTLEAAQYMCVSWSRSNDKKEQGIWTPSSCRNADVEPGILHLCDCSDTSYIAQYITINNDTVNNTTTTTNTTLSIPYTTSEESTEAETSTSSTTLKTTTVVLTPDEQVDQILDDLKNLLDSDTTPIYMDDVTDVFDQINNVLSIDEDVIIPGEMLQMLDELGSRIDLNESSNAILVKNNIAMLIADAGDLNPIRGLRVARREVDGFINDAFEFINEDIDEMHIMESESEAVVDLPPSVLNSPRRISFVVFHDDRAFHYSGVSAVNSRVISINVENVTLFDAGEMVRIHFRRKVGPERDMRRSCGYWAFLENGAGYWSQEGCTFIRSSNPAILDTCQCSHLTHFAEILIPRPVFSERNEHILEILSIIGSFLSIFGVLIIALTAVMFKSWRSNFRNRIWLQLCIALFLLSVCFLVIIYMRYDVYNLPCLINGIVLHYSLLASFFWMLMVAIIAYIDTVGFKYAYTKHISHKVLITASISWGTPVVIIGILLLAAPYSYVGTFEEMTPSGTFCYPSGMGLWLTVYTPICIILLANFVSFFYIMGVVSSSTRNKKLGKQNVDEFQEAVKCVRIALVLVFLFGLPWVFGLFSHNIVAAYIFTVTVTTQGFFLFLFIVCGNRDTRTFWRRQLMWKTKDKYECHSLKESKRNTGSTTTFAY
ncbi:adhesion G-protein coupled receptor G2-like [Achroia grisella]|uniref:adhesion G-protein coupled receptor G2-like n=1 Tax=Achroia grisella TaxID=688607 RepID=UPI0027D30A06|nr:adhesion G-protein coupled receptor G2-like [Achroia grisella]